MTDALTRLRALCLALPEVTEKTPTRFFRPPYVGGRGWLGVYLDVDDVDWDEIGEIVLDAYRVIAPRKLTALLD